MKLSRCGWYINDLSGNLESNVKLYAKNTSIFLVVRDPFNTSQKINNVLDKVSLLTDKCKMSFNPDLSTQAQ